MVYRGRATSMAWASVRGRTRPHLRQGQMAENVRWRELQDLFEHVPLGDSAKDGLFAEMGRPGRLYHGLRHLETLWRRHGLYSPEAGLAGAGPAPPFARPIAFHGSAHARHRE